LEALGQERCQFVTIGGDVIQDLLDGGAKLGECRVVAVAGNLPLQKFPEALNQIQIGRIGRQIQ
jgi:hypothetical protein